MQADLRKREIRKKTIALPPEFLVFRCIMSLEIVVFLNKEREVRAYDALEERYFDLPDVLEPLFLESTIIF